MAGEQLSPEDFQSEAPPQDTGGVTAYYLGPVGSPPDDATPPPVATVPAPKTLSLQEFTDDGSGAPVSAPPVPSVMNGFAGLGRGEIQAPMVDTGPLGSLGALVRSFANGVSGGWADKGAAFMDSVLPVAGGANPGQTYSANLTHENALTSQAQDFHPLASLIGSFPGQVTQGFLLPEAKAASIGGRLLQGAAQGGLLGGINASGHARGDAGQVLAQTLLPAVEGMAGGAALGGLLGPAHPSSGADVLAPYNRVGVNPMLAVNGSTSVQKIAQTLKGMPLAGSPLEAGAATTAGQLRGGLVDTASSLGPATTPFQAGSALQSGANQAVVGMKTTADRLYEPINAIDSSPTLIPMSNTLGAVNDEIAKFPTLGASYVKSVSPKLVDIQSRIQNAGGNLNFGEARALRTDVGTMLRDQTLGDTDQARLKGLYGALSSDIMQGAGPVARTDAIAAGQTPRMAIRSGVNAQDALERADTYNSAMHARVDDTLSSVLNAPTPEAAYNKVVAAAQGGARADLQTVQRLKRSLDPDS